ncbi:hypothetical protein GGI12_005672 [Dipsacomyces acuminosporus]|nr:hypothetical protein GGI12_005672 [Dipsacomyces acuminosporus]
MGTESLSPKIVFATDSINRILDADSCDLQGSQATDPRCVSVEFMAMGSNDGAIMLCQLVRPWIAGRSENVRYISLEDIISSDPETSDIPEFWDVMESN